MSYLLPSRKIITLPNILTECSSRHLVTMSSVPNLSILLTLGGMVP